MTPQPGVPNKDTIDIKQDRELPRTCKRAIGKSLTTEFTITQGPRALGLNAGLIVEAAVGGLKNVADNIQNETANLLGRRECGGFIGTALPKRNTTALNKRSGNKRSLNKRNYLTAIRDAVAFARAQIYGKYRKDRTRESIAERTERREAKERASKKGHEAYTALTLLASKRYIREHGLIQECKVCNGAEKTQGHNNKRCNAECFEAKKPIPARPK